jgi:hypothetical protein
MIYCCKDCVAPKRQPGCHGSCPEYISEKAEHDRIKAEHDKQRDISVGICGERSKKVYNAMKDRRNKKI